MRSLLLVALVGLVSMPLASAAPFLQLGHDAGRTGDVRGPGPGEHEVALAVQLPGARVRGAPPLVIERHVYVLTQALVEGLPVGLEAPEGLDRNALFVVDTETGNVGELLSFEAPATGLASDGTALFLAEAERVAAYGLDGTERWVHPYPDAMPPVDGRRTLCVAPAVLADQVVVACTQRPPGDDPVAGRPAQAPYQGEAGAASFVLGLDTRDGTLAFEWPPQEPSAPVPVQSYPDSACTQDAAGHVVDSVLATEDHALVSLGREPFWGKDNSNQYVVHDIDPSTGQVRWSFCSDEMWSDLANVGTGDDYATAPPALAIAGDSLYVNHDDLLRVDLQTGTLELLHNWGNRPLGEPPGSPQHDQPSLVVRGGDLLGTGYSEIRRYDLNADEIVWRQSVPQNAEFVVVHPLAAGGILYHPTDDGVLAMDARGGAVLWSHHAGPVPPQLALGEGILAVRTLFGELSVIGRTSASIQPSVAPSDRWPAPGEPVEVDLSATAPGPFDGSLEYRATWGDGSGTGWQEEPRFEHAYDEASEYSARFEVRNQAGQLSGETIVFDVGGEPPADLNLLQTAFARDNQDLTFGVLGVALALGGGLVAVGRTRRRRGRLQAELDAIERLVDGAGTPVEVEAMVSERRAHVRGLIVDGKLDEGQGQVVERRLDEVQREGRMDEIEDLLDQLPHGLVRHLREVLADGRVTAFERDSILSLVERDGLVPDGVKAAVRERIEAWFARDGG